MGWTAYNSIHNFPPTQSVALALNERIEALQEYNISSSSPANVPECLETCNNFQSYLAAYDAILTSLIPLFLSVTPLGADSYIPATPQKEWTVESIYEFIGEDRILISEAMLCPTFFRKWYNQVQAVINLLLFIRDANEYDLSDLFDISGEHTGLSAGGTVVSHNFIPEVELETAELWIESRLKAEVADDSGAGFDTRNAFIISNNIDVFCRRDTTDAFQAVHNYWNFANISGSQTFTRTGNHPDIIMSFPITVKFSQVAGSEKAPIEIGELVAAYPPYVVNGDGSYWHLLGYASSSISVGEAVTFAISAGEPYEIALENWYLAYSQGYYSLYHPDNDDIGWYATAPGYNSTVGGEQPAPYHRPDFEFTEGS
jgi:hypothetical protein